MLERFRSTLFLRNALARTALAEFFGTFLLVFIGECIVAQFHLGISDFRPRRADFGWTQICVGWGFAVTFSIMAVAKVSGGHLNPAVTLMLYTFGKIDTLRMVAYVVAQTAGAFVGAAGTYAVYYDAIHTYDPLLNTTAGIFTTFPPASGYLSASGVFIDQVAGTGVLCVFIAVIIDPRNEVPAHLHALLFGFVIMMVIAGFGLHIGSPINPARDFGPRLFSALVYGSNVFTLTHIVEGGWYTYFLLPILGPLVGAVLAGWLYAIFAGYQIPAAVAAKDNDDCAGGTTAAVALGCCYQQKASATAATTTTNNNNRRTPKNGGGTNAALLQQK